VLENAAKIGTITIELPHWHAKGRGLGLQIEGVSVEATSRVFPEVRSWKYQHSVGSLTLHYL
jgi:hypothetical protein